jgi:hypothetical protein
VRHHATAAAVAAVLVSVGLWGVVVLTAPAVAGASPRSNDLAQARRALLVLSDMPAGWTTAKNSNNSNNNVGDKQLAQCIGVATTLIAENPPSVNSPQFQDKQGSLMVTDNVTVFPTTENAAAEFAIATDAKTPGCMTQLASGPLKSQLFGKTPTGVSIGTPLVSPIAASAFGPHTGGYSLSVPLDSHGQIVNLTVTQLFAVRGKLGQQITFTAIGEPFSISLEQHLTAVAVDRL